MGPFRKAKAEQAAIKCGLYGPTGSGKTFTSLLFAEALCNLTGGRCAYVDTEHGTDWYCKTVPERSVHPEAFDFDALYTRSLTETTAAVRQLSPKEHSVIIVDSITHLWEAARAAYDGRTTKAGTIPFQAWGKIKKPYKELINLLLNCPQHVFICGRQGNEFAEDEQTGELKRVGVKMKAEGETPYEPHILLRMEAIRKGQGQATITAFAEKDRTGVLAGKTFSNPTFASVMQPIVKLLGNTQAQMADEDTVAAHDAEALAEQEAGRDRTSKKLFESLVARITLAETADDLAVVAGEITPALKKQLTTAHVSELRECYLEAEGILGKPTGPKKSAAKASAPTTKSEAAMAVQAPLPQDTPTPSGPPDTPPAAESPAQAAPASPTTSEGPIGWESELYKKVWAAHDKLAGPQRTAIRKELNFKLITDVTTWNEMDANDALIAINAKLAEAVT